MSCRSCRGPAPRCCLVGRVPLTAADVARLDSEVSLLPARPGYVAELPRRASGACVMLDGDRCAIYATRPQACRDQDQAACLRAAGA
jgi:Fe-S-cluster containining protein